MLHSQTKAKHNVNEGGIRQGIGNGSNGTELTQRRPAKATSGLRKPFERSKPLKAERDIITRVICIN